MRRVLFALSYLLAIALLSPAGLSAHAATCTALNPNFQRIETTPTADFDYNGDGTMTHTKTGLMWKKCAEGLTTASCGLGSVALMTWANALSAANAANLAAFAGHTDWRLPNKKEIESIIEHCGSNPAINLIVFPNTPSFFFWSSTSYVPTPANAWGAFFNRGNSDSNAKVNTGAVRLVRGVQAPVSFDLLNPVNPNCTLDVDGNNTTDALTDGLLILRAMFGLTGAAVTNGAIGSNPSRST